VFLTFSIVAFQSQRWYRTCALASDDETWADPWMRRWIAEQEAKQHVPELTSGLRTPPARQSDHVILKELRNVCARSSAR
jgi:hypothetical protein